MRIDTRRKHRNAGRPTEKDARGFLAYLRQRDCIFADSGDCEGKTEAAHLDFAGDKGLSTKVSDSFAVPMCGKHHRLQHNKGWITFLRLMKATKEQLLAAADRYWRSWPSRARWEAKQRDAA